MNQTPLNVHIIWHSEYETGLDFAEFLYNRLTRNVGDSLSRGIGIPIYFHTHKNSSIDFNDSKRNILIIFINSSSLKDESWNGFINDLNKSTNLDSNSLLIPVAISKQSYKVKGEISKRNFIRLFDKKEIEEKKRLLIQRISNEMCRFLYGANRISDIPKTKKSKSLPVKLFISHTKIDGMKIAKQINNYILSETPLKTFFDANDIRTGEYFRDEIIDNIKSDDSVMLVIQSDKYSSREWCRTEVIEAKTFNRPIVVLNRLENGEYRSFPYMANVRTIKRGDSSVKLEINEIEDIIVETLLETLKFKFQNLLISYFVESFNIKDLKIQILSYPPELLSCLNIKENTIVFYPEPPLSEEEIKILNKIGKSIRYLTPSQIPILNRKIDSENINVGLSISSNEELSKYGISKIHLKDYFVEMSRYIISSKFKISFGGDLNWSEQDNYSSILVDLIHTYNRNTSMKDNIITNYVASYLVEKITEEQEVEAYPYIKFEKIKETTIERKIGEISRIKKAISLSNMRKIMNDNINCRISIGGKSTKFLGIYPGVLEEIIIALKTRKPLFLIGGFGGVTKAVTDFLSKGNSNIITNEYQFKDPEYKKFHLDYNSFAEKHGIKKIDYDEMQDFLKKIDISHLNNGLTKEENLELFLTRDLVKIITLVLKGIINLGKKE